MKKIISVMLSLIMVFVMASTSFASEIETMNDIRIRDINENIMKNVEAKFVSETGEVLPMDLEVETTIEPNYDRMYLSYDSPVVFKSKVKVSTTKAKFNKNHSGGVEGAAKLEMTWVDVLGNKNKIIKLAGECTVSAGTFKKGIVYWGGNYDGVSNAPYKKEVGDDFEMDVDYTSDARFGTVRSSYNAYVKSPRYDDGRTYQLTLHVNPLI